MPPRPPKPPERQRIRGQSVLTGAAAREALIRGLNTMSAAVRPTLGPAARTVAIAPISGQGPPEVLDRAATIARRTIAIEDPFQNMGAMLLRHLIWRVHEEVGDGGATAAVIAARLTESTVNYAGLGGDTLAMRRGIQIAADAVADRLRRLSRPIEMPREIATVVSGSLRNEPIALMIGEVLDAVGPDGVITVRKSPGVSTDCEFVEGVRWDGGSVSWHLLDDAVQTTTLDEPVILVTDFPLKDADDVLPILELASSAGRPLLLIASEVRDAALAMLIANRERGILAVKPPEPGGQRERAIEEIALICGARLQRRARNDRLRDVKLEDLGSARQAWATRGLAGLLGARGDREAIRVRLRDVQAELERASDEDAREKLRARIGRLSGIAVVIRVGGQTESEQKELEQRVESAVAAGRAALREGVVPGGGCALIAAAKTVSALDLTGDERVGARLLARSLEEPLRVIAINAGIDDAPLVHHACERGPDFVFDVLHRKWVDPWQAGILDATSILRQVVDLSVSSAVTTLFTDTLVRSPTPANALTP